MALARPVSILLQNLWQTWVYALVFVLVSIFSGAFIGVAIAFVVASIGSFAYRRFVNRALPIPPRTAVLITGCSTGIGEDAAVRFSQLGWLVFATVRKEEDGEKLRKKAGNNLLHPLVLDVTNAEQIQQAVKAAKERLGKEGEQRQLMGLINNGQAGQGIPHHLPSSPFSLRCSSALNHSLDCAGPLLILPSFCPCVVLLLLAGYAEYFPAELSPPDLFRRMFETNVVGTIAVTQAFLPLLRDFSASSSHGARVILLSSVVGRFTGGGLSSYSATKHSVEAIGDALRMELSKWGIRVSIIEPGAVGTNFYGALEGQQKKRFAECKAALEKGQLACGGAVLERYIGCMEKTMKGLEKVPRENVEFCTDVLEMALTDSQPLSRYTAGWTSIAIQIFTKLPTELYDIALGSDYK